MSQDFHEHLERPEIKPPSPRGTGIVFAVVAAIVAYLYWENATVFAIASGASGALLLVSLLAPGLLKPLNILWFKFGLLLHKIVNPLVMGLMFFLIITPAGFLMRRFRDPLLAKPPEKAKSFWQDRKPQTASLKNQF